MTEATELDRRFMAAAIRLGAGALGTTWPNPAVGAILVKDGIVVGRGRTAPGGRPHAEPQALAQAGPAARGATLYVSLEPCSHHGRTPPCADAVIASGVSRVVTAMADPDVRVAGAGIARLRGAGVEVVEPLLEGSARQAHAGHIRRVVSGRPHVLLKLAISAEGAIGIRGERQVSISGDAARRHAQAMRSRSDAIMVGRGTVEADDPELTCRLAGLESRSPVRIVLATGGALPRDRKVFHGGKSPVWVLTGDREEESERARYMAVGTSPDGHLDLPTALRRLATEGITRVLVEGGASLARSLIEADLVDEIVIFRSPVALTAAGGLLVPALAGLPLAALENTRRFRQVDRRLFGVDRMTRYERAA